MSEDCWYRLDQIAEMNSMSFRALSDAARSGTLVTYKKFGRRYVRWSDFEAFMKQSLVPVSPEHVKQDPIEQLIKMNERRQRRAANKKK